MNTRIAKKLKIPFTEFGQYSHEWQKYQFRPLFYDYHFVLVKPTETYS